MSSRRLSEKTSLEARYVLLADAALHEANKRKPCWREATFSTAGVPRLLPNGADVGGWGTLLLATREASGGLARVWRVQSANNATYAIPISAAGGTRLLPVTPEPGVLQAATAARAAASKPAFAEFIAPYRAFLKANGLKEKQLWALVDLFAAMTNHQIVREPWSPGFTDTSLPLAAGLAWSFLVGSAAPQKSPLPGPYFPAELRYAKNEGGKYLSLVASGVLAWPEPDRDQAHQKIRGKSGRNAWVRDASPHFWWKAALILAGFGKHATGDTVQDWRLVGRVIAEKLDSLDFGALDTLETLHAAIPAWQKVVARHRHTSLPHLLHRMTYRDLLRDGRWDRSLLVPRLREQMIDQEKLSHVALARVGHQKMLGALRRKFEIPREQKVLEALEAVVNPDATLRVRSSAKVVSPDELTARWFRLLNAIPEKRYNRHALEKRAGGVRWLDVPIPMVGTMQRILVHELMPIYPPNDWACAFLPYRGPAWHAHIHAGAHSAVVVDIRDFFGSVRPRHVERWFGLANEPDVHATNLLPAWTIAGREAILNLIFATDGRKHHWLPQGAPTSPWFANLAANRLDVLVSLGAQRQFGEDVRYSRYADDLLLSLGATMEDVRPRDLLAFARGVLQKAGFEVNAEKVRLWQNDHEGPLVACGVIVPAKPGESCRLTGDMRKRARAALHRARHLDYSRTEWSKEIQADRGMLSFAYAATGNPGWLAYTSRPLWEFAKAVAGVVFAEALLAGVADFLDNDQKP